MKAPTKLICVSTFVTMATLAGAVLATPSKVVPTEAEKGCSSGDGDACVELGVNLEGAVPANPKGAAAMFRRACQYKSAEGCTRAGQPLKACELGATEQCAGLCNKGTIPACVLGCSQGDEVQCAKSCTGPADAKCSPDRLSEMCAKGKAQACEMAQCVQGDTPKCDALCKLEVMPACERASSDVQSRVADRVERRHAEDRLPVLMADCQKHRARWLQANASLTGARQARSPARESTAEDAMEESKNALLETRNELQGVVMLLTHGTGTRFGALREEGRAKCNVRRP